VFDEPIPLLRGAGENEVGSHVELQPGNDRQARPVLRRRGAAGRVALWGVGKEREPRVGLFGTGRLIMAFGESAEAGKGWVGGLDLHSKPTLEQLFQLFVALRGQYRCDRFQTVPFEDHSPKEQELEEMSVSVPSLFAFSRPPVDEAGSHVETNQALSDRVLATLARRSCRKETRNKVIG